MKKAIFLDFYGTVVFEDGENIEKISKIIQDTGEVKDISEVGSYWWNEFYALFVNAYGEAFRTQREIELQSLAKTIHRELFRFKSKQTAEDHRSDSR